MVNLEWYAFILVVFTCHYTQATETDQLWRKQNDGSDKINGYLDDSKAAYSEGYIPLDEYRAIHHVPMEDQDSNEIGHHKRGFGASSFAPMRGKRTFGDDFGDEIDSEDMIDPRERRGGLSSFIASRGKRLQDESPLYKDADLFRKRGGGFGPSSFVGGRGKRMTPMFSVPNAKYQQMLGRVIDAVLKLSEEKTKGEAPATEKRHFGFTALRGRR